MQSCYEKKPEIVKSGFYSSSKVEEEKSISISYDIVTGTEKVETRNIICKSLTLY